MIKPTVGRKVWYRPSQFDQSGEGMMVTNSDQPLDATIVAVASDEIINLVVFDAVGKQFVRLSTPLMQEGAGSTAGGYAEWMPYQVGQAKKQESAA
jgi:hypothetical protein